MIGTYFEARIAASIESRAEVASPAAWALLIRLSTAGTLRFDELLPFTTACWLEKYSQGISTGSAPSGELPMI